ncbi:hypothetical protein [Paenibacillus hubeiensis]|uniref:hypothetical protein n=1 Tax=Paenibacillus hubeiensis TaxID=3077330 RepID=UPI0031BA7D5B
MPDETKKAPTAKAAAAKETQSAATTKSSTYVYLGPTLKTYPLRQNATYVNGIPAQFRQLVDTNADVAFLFVPLEKTVEYRRELKEPASEQSFVFKEIQKSGV